MKFNYSLLGLEPRDIKIYEALLSRHEAASIRSIAEASGFNRGTTYEVIKKLQNTGLVHAHFKNRRKFYAAAAPGALTKLFTDHQQKLANEEGAVAHYVTGLKNSIAKDYEEQFTRYYNGEDEIASLLRDVLQDVAASRERSYSVFSSAQVRNQLYKRFRDFTKQRIAAGIFVRVLAVGKISSSAALSKARLLNAKQAPPAYTIIYGDKIALISISNWGDIQGALIHNKGIAQLQQLAFEAIWQNL